MRDSAQERKTEDACQHTLAIIQDRLRRESVQFKLGAHFLDLRGLLFHRCYEFLDFSLLLGVVRFQFLHFAMLFEKFVKQHRVHLVVADAVGFSFLVAHYQIRIDLFHIFGHEAQLWCGGCIDLFL